MFSPHVYCITARDLWIINSLYENDMSGRKQHYIPQSLLRGFGKQGKGKAIQVTVYSQDRGVFTAATDGIAAQRYFYSELPDNAETQTLDGQITAYEPRLAEIITEFRTIEPGHPIDPARAAEVVSHLCLRHAHLRDSFSLATGSLLQGAEKTFLDKARFWKAIGLDAPTPNKMVREELEKLYDQFEIELSQLGVDRSAFVEWAYTQAKADFDQNFEARLPLLQTALGEMQDQTDRLAREGHIKALDQTLAPEARVDALKQFAWRLEPGPVTGLVLPDCVAIGFATEEGYLPVALTGKDQVDTVFMPFSHDRLLVGERGGGVSEVPSEINEMFVDCSLDFFLARDRVPEFEQLISIIGNRTRGFLDDAVSGVLKEYE